MSNGVNRADPIQKIARVITAHLEAAQGITVTKSEKNCVFISHKKEDTDEIWLFGADLTGADLTGANLEGADLTGANLRKANLTGANLSEADLQDADLEGANLDGANLEGTILQ